MVVSSFCYGFCDDDAGLAVDMEFIEAEKETKGEPDEIILSLGHTVLDIYCVLYICLDR